MKLTLKHLDAVKRPARYCGGEFNSVAPPAHADLRFCLCVPDSYEVGMSNLGTKILYGIMNGMPGVSCERCFAPWQDYAAALAAENAPLASLESARPLASFDVVGFSFQYELGYSNFFYMLDLAGIPLTSAERGESFPLIIAGGPCCVNPEPMYKFVDLFYVGDGETALPDILNQIIDSKRQKLTKTQLLKRLSDTFDCVYVPALGTQKPVVSAKVFDLDNSYFPTNQIVSNIEIVHDRAVVELFRGCYNGCRFCQAGFLYRPVRMRSAANAARLCRELCQNCGFDELSISSLSTGDYPQLKELYAELKPFAETQNIKISLPSLRLDTFDAELYAAGDGRKMALTFAPEAGTQRLRNVINKNITEDDILHSTAAAFAAGYSSVKLYFMLGLPTETMEDMEAIVALVVKIREQFFALRKSKSMLKISVSASTFVPKPFTPFMWEAFATRADIDRKQQYLMTNLRMKNVTFSWHDPNCSLLEAALARGGREMADVLLEAYRQGARFDAWGEHFNYAHYKKAFEICGVDAEKIVGARDIGAPLPWDFISVGVDKEYFAREREAAYAAQTTAACNKKCNGCGLAGKGCEIC